MKRSFNQRSYANFYFWRTYDQKEIDLIEESQGVLNAFEFKWKEGAINRKAETEFTATYENSQFHVVTQSRFDEFLAG
jgi:uncharacterized protein